MKRFIIILLLICFGISFAQVPQSIKYQTVVRDANGDIMAGQNVSFRIIIHESSPSGGIVYTETHNVTTNDFGLATFNIGEGIPQVGQFGNIDWGNNPKFLEVDFDVAGGSNYITMGISQLLSVPYALYSQSTADKDDADADPSNELNYTVVLNGSTLQITDAGGMLSADLSSLIDDADADPANELQTLSINADTLSISNGNQITLPGDNLGNHTASQNISLNGNYISFDGDDEGVFVNSQGYVGINTANPASALTVNGNIKSSDYIISKFGTTTDASFRFGNGNENSGLSSPFYNSVSIITDGNSRLMVSDNGNVGIGTDVPEETLHINGSFRLNNGSEGVGKILVSDETGTADWVDAGQATGWVKNGNYLYNINDSIGIGTGQPVARLDVHGHIAQTGTGHSVIIGEGAGANDNADNSRNVFIGEAAGYHNNTGKNNVAIGNAALFRATNRSNLVAIGDSALFNNGWGVNPPYVNGGYENTALGSKTLMNNTTGYSNTATGFEALHNNGTGNSNTATGSMALFNNTSGDNNTATGSGALRYNTTGYCNTSTGTGSLLYCTTGSENTAMGYSALAINTTGDNNVAIGSVALHGNSTGFSNVAIGISTLYHNSDRNNLVAIGDSALFHNGIGAANSSQATCNLAVGSKSLFENTTGRSNTAVGFETLLNNTGGDENTAMGASALTSNTTGGGNTAAGSYALFSNTTGHSNTATGSKALYNNYLGIKNTAMGSSALENNTTGDNNVAIGTEALHENSTGSSNVAIGIRTLYHNTIRSNLVAIGDSALFYNCWGLLPPYNDGGYENTALGTKTLMRNTTGNRNTAAGSTALYNNTSGSYNTAAGSRALYNNTTGVENTAIGVLSLFDNITGNYNTVTGSRALYNNTTGDYNTAIGIYALNDNVDGSNNTALGAYSFLQGNYDNSTAIGYHSQITASNQVRIGNSNVTSIGGFAAWTNLSDGRFKKNVKENVPGLELIMKLRPVTYNLDIEALASFRHTPDSLRMKESERVKESEVQIGFIAQEVEKAADEVGFDFDGVHHPANEHDPYSLAYAEFVVPLVKATQEQQKLIETLQKENKELKEQLNRIELLLKNKN